MARRPGTALGSGSAGRRLLGQHRIRSTVLHGPTRWFEGARWFEGTKRAAAERRPEVKKAGVAMTQMIKDWANTYIWGPTSRNETINVHKVRTIVRIVIEYYTFCRTSDYIQLQATETVKI